MKRASYREAVRWIANNDNPGDGDSATQVAGYISTLLVADLFDIEPDRVAREVMRERTPFRPACVYPQECKSLKRCIRPDDHDQPRACKK